MSIFSILMVLDNFNLDQESSQSIPIRAAAHTLKRDVDPAFWLCEF